MIDVTIEQVSSEVGSATLHGWNTCRLVKTGGALWFAANKPSPEDDDGSDWLVQRTLMYRRELTPDGKWELAEDIDPRTYTCCIDHLGRFWSISPKHFNYITLWRSGANMDLDDLVRCYDGRCAYLGMGVDRVTGNHLLIHPEDTNHMPRFPNPMVCVYYDVETDSWAKSSIEMPEGRFGYMGIMVRGRKAVVLMQSTQFDQIVEPNEPHYNWRLLQLARCDNLLEGKWVKKPLAMRKFGQSLPSDMVEMPDGRILIVYKHRGGDESYEATQGLPYALHISVVNPDDLSFETFTPNIDVEPSGRVFLGSDGRWYLVGKPEPDAAWRLWRLDADNGFEPTADWDLPGTDVLKSMLHTLRPDRVGGEDDGDTIHLTSSDTPGVPFGDSRDRFAIMHAHFKLPVNE